MNQRFTVTIEREDDTYVALCPELDIASQGKTAVHARRNLSEALELFLVSASPTEVRDRFRSQTLPRN
ncbi:MAG: type II toxin-antitoxin system HicB family antitoxin [Pseudomonadota bacterium]|nr:MAG: type II toxin-antitoxin system HicB family antitoxin [Pseudomonadota bacterium]